MLRTLFPECPFEPFESAIYLQYLTATSFVSYIPEIPVRLYVIKRMETLAAGWSGSSRGGSRRSSWCQRREGGGKGGEGGEGGGEGRKDDSVKGELDDEGNWGKKDDEETRNSESSSVRLVVMFDVKPIDRSKANSEKRKETDAVKKATSWNQRATEDTVNDIIKVEKC